MSQVHELSSNVQSLLKNPSDLIPAIAQDADTGEVLMLAWMNQASLALTIDTGRATYWSRSRNELWVKGATSGHTQTVRSMALDCDGDALLLRVDQVGGACHTGAKTCFHQPLTMGN
jgi:phosphoribosyl-AMP cyclohydrolase